MVTTLGPVARGAGRLQATAQTTLANASRRMLMKVLSGSTSFEQDDAGHAPELLPLGLGIQPRDQVPKPPQRHRPVEAERFLPHRAEFGFLPALRPEELRPLRGREDR